MLSNLGKKVHSNVELKEKKTKVASEKKRQVQIKGKKIRNNVKMVEGSNCEKNHKKSIFTKKNIIYFILFLLDASLVIYVARENVVNYVKIVDQDIFVSQTRNLFLGRNYITLVITAFFYLYICLIHRFFLREKNTKKFLIWLLVILLLLNFLLFFLFTKRIY